MLRPSNEHIAEVLDRISDLLEVQGGSTFRVRAYRKAARTVRETTDPLAIIAEREGIEGLEKLPNIGKSISSVILEFVHNGRVVLLERLEGQVSPEDLFTTVPGVGEVLASKIHRELKIDTLEELELAAHDRRLENLGGFGERRVRGIRNALAAMLSRSGRRRARRLRWLETHNKDNEVNQPSVGLLLKIDEQYRSRAEAGELKTITPRRFNSERRAWLPVLHIDEDGWSFTAMYSNSARAHELGKTRDWVIIFYERNGDEDQCTVVSERGGILKGLRVIRGRESDCLSYYKGQISSVNRRQ
ncbi:MAG: DNA-binding protein [Deltaproteobacteria bacterium]|nr:DNA-binding protein [Deltaproteobacteria bacterium]